MPAGRALALDLDGTLIDARIRQAGVAAEVLAAVCGAELDQDAFWAAKRAGATTADALAALGFSSSVAASVARGWAERMESDDWLARDRALPGVVDALGSLDGSVLVVTARRRASGAEISLGAAGLEGLVDDVVVVEPVRAAEAKAGVLVQRDARAFVGDTTSDGEAARRAGVPFVAVDTGQRTAAVSARGGAGRRALAGRGPAAARARAGICGRLAPDAG